MMTVIMILLAVWISAAAGHVLIQRLNILAGRRALERFTYAAALGLGIAAYGVYALGLCGLLSFWPVTLWWLALGAVGARASLADARDLAGRLKFKSRMRASGIGSASAGALDAGNRTGDPARDALGTLAARRTSVGERWIIRACGCILMVFGLIALLACFRPPGPQEWDVLSYHLADPKLFLLAHRVQTLPTEHHSNFPFTMEMLYTVGLLYSGYALANAFHLAMTLLTIGALIGFTRRLGSPVAGWLGSVTYLTTPVVLWEATTAYIDTGLALYVTLATFALITSLRLPKDARGEGQARSWLILGGAMMGFALGIKYLALIPLVLLGVLLASQRMPLKRIALYACVALAVGSPWYIKNILIMYNPVYPFEYNVFRHSRYWSADRAAGYQSEQKKFGTKPLSVDVRSKLLNLSRIPWDLLRQHPAQSSRPALLYCNPGEFTFTALYGGLYAALLFPLAFARRVPRTIRMLVWLGAAQIAAWFLLSQVGRYLIQIMPILALAGAYTAVRWAFGTDTSESDDPDTISGMDSSNHDNNNAPRRGSSRRSASTWPGLLGIGAVFGQAAYVLLSVSTLPLSASAQEAMALMQLGQMPSGVSLPALAANLGRAGRWEQDLQRHFDAYSAMQWINRNTPADAGVALYEETRGFYLDRPYLWANQQHSSYIPYETMRDGAELSAWMLRHDCRYALINLNASAQNQRAYTNDAAVTAPELADGPNRHEDMALDMWYTRSVGGDQGHQLVGDALRRGLWTPVFANHGCVVLQINPAPLEKGDRP